MFRKMNYLKGENNKCKCMRQMDDAFKIVVASFLHFGLICLFISISLIPTISSNTTTADYSSNSLQQQQSNQFSITEIANESIDIKQHNKHPRRRIYVIRQSSIRYRRAREQCSEEEMLQVEGIPLLEIFNLLASSATEKWDKLDKELMRAAFGEKLLSLDGGIQAEGKNCSSKNVWMEEWRRQRRSRNGRAGKRKRPMDKIKPGMPLEMRAICPFERVINTDGHRLPKRIPEIRCISNWPSYLAEYGDQFNCEPLYHHIPVLKFELDCKKFRPTLQRISISCMAVFNSRSLSNFDAKIGQPQNAIIESSLR